MEDAWHAGCKGLQRQALPRRFPDIVSGQKGSVVRCAESADDGSRWEAWWNQAHPPGCWQEKSAPRRGACTWGQTISHAPLSQWSEASHRVPSKAPLGLEAPTNTQACPPKSSGNPHGTLHTPGRPAGCWGTFFCRRGHVQRRSYINWLSSRPRSFRRDFLIVSTSAVMR